MKQNKSSTTKTAAAKGLKYLYTKENAAKPNSYAPSQLKTYTTQGVTMKVAPSSTKNASSTHFQPLLENPKAQM